ncbi:MAG: hypothetical protein DMD90_19595 [Candidatus Rokuibacteriota bacterium]|nr:MAG: hypothetical protein DMD90_19595 [Candidatus Rokubacteria bacterium]
MRKRAHSGRMNEMRKEYDFRGGIRGKYAARVRERSNIVVLDADVAAAFPNSSAVNRALRALLEIVPRRPLRRRARRA